MGTARGSFLRRWRLLGIDGFEIDVPDSSENAAEFGYAGSGDNRSAFPKARVVALAECGTHAFVAAEVDAYSRRGEDPGARLYPRLRADELLTADRGFYSWPAWDTAAATGAGLIPASRQGEYPDDVFVEYDERRRPEGPARPEDATRRARSSTASPGATARPPPRTTRPSR